MEPMTLGSPVGSPSSPGSGSAYLPGFLIGENTHSPHPSSPTKTPRQVGGMNTIPVTPRSLNRLNISPACERRSRTVHVNTVEKPGGPPTVGLFDTLDSTSVPSRSTPATTNINIAQNMQMGMMTPNTPIRNLENSTLIDPCSANTVSSTVENWVTVFGFPPSAASTILSQFSQLGQLLEHKFPPKGNWVHLRYYSKMEARRAMTYHGKIFGGSTMIGVMPCRDPNIMKSCSTGLESPQVVKLPNRIVSPLNNASNLWTPDNSIIHSPRARSLSRAPCYTENEVLSAHNTPVRNTGLFSRTIDYIFGW